MGAYGGAEGSMGVYGGLQDSMGDLGMYGAV